MPDFRSEYEQALLQARQRYTQRTQPRILRRLRTEYAEMLLAITEATTGGQITEQRAREMKATINAEMNDLERRLSRTLERGTLSAAEDAAAGHRRGLRAASAATGVDVTQSFNDVPAQVLEDLMVRRDLGVATTFKSLIRRNLQDAARDIDRYLAQSIGRGITYDAAGRELAALMAREDPELLNTLRQLGAKGGRLREGILGTDVSDLPRLTEARGLLFDARRILITETNASFYESNRASMQRSPAVDLAQWTLSARHHNLPSSPDICTLYSEEDLHGFGPGLYHPASAPAQPHPFCMCSLAPTFLPPERWGEERELPSPRELTQDDVRAALERQASSSSRSITDARVRQDWRRLKGLETADSVARG